MACSDLSGKLSPGVSDFNTPIVCYVGRHPSEKGIDLLLYAMKIPIDRGKQLQLVIVGANGFRLWYQHDCKQIAGHLGLNVIRKNQVSMEPHPATGNHSAILHAVRIET